jgi:hypothetical protein
MNGVTEVEFTETVNTKSRVPHIYKILFTLQAVSLLIVYVASMGWLY